MALNQKIRVSLVGYPQASSIVGVIASQGTHGDTQTMTISNPILESVKDNKTEIENQRYKQDCRKRAFEMAHAELMSLLSQNKGADFSVTEQADKYYNWLISIPVDKS